MPWIMGDKKHQDVSSAAARIRDNQRRSRARQREYVDELKVRISEYERAGVQATLDMRQAARAVALENSRLRSLLASRGLTDNDIDMYLASFTGSDQAVEPVPPAREFHAPQTMLSYHRPAPEITATAMAARQRGLDAGTYGPAFLAEAPENSVGPTRSQHLSALDMLADASVQQTCCGPTTQCAPSDVLPLARVQVPILPSPARRADSGTAPPTPGSNTPNTTTSSHMEMSCTAAAQIMASISYRDRDEAVAREALGCSGPDECFVKNTTLFRLLERPDGL